MHIVRYRAGPEVSLGALVGDRVINLPRLCGAPAEINAFLSDPDLTALAQEAILRLSASDLAAQPGISEVDRLLPLPSPGKIIGAGMNYPAAGWERGKRPAFPVLFERNPGSLIGPYAAIRLPRQAREVVIECELALVVGRGGKHIREERALQTLAGYTIANDVTARDLERRSSQWTSGKLFDAFLPVGPEIATLDEIPDPSGLKIRSWINSDPVQEGSTRDMLYSPAELVAYISSLITLYPGDLILTGSPKRLGNVSAPEAYLKPGDHVRLEIEGLAVLENPVEAEEDE